MVLLDAADAVLAAEADADAEADNGVILVGPLEVGGDFSSLLLFRLFAMTGTGGMGVVVVCNEAASEYTTTLMPDSEVKNQRQRREEATRARNATHSLLEATSSNKIL